MALRSVLLGYCYKPVDDAVKAAIDKGISFTRSNPYEGELREIITQELRLGEACKFGKNGSDATHAAVKLARAYTGRDIVLIASVNPFISTADFFIGSTVVDGGIPYCVECTDVQVQKYSYDKMLEKTFPKERHFTVNPKYEVTELEWMCSAFKPAAIILDPATVDIAKEKLQYIRDLCDKYGILMILDETISGFRYDIRGVQGLYGIKPDLACYGKGMGNGYSISCLAGRKEIMDLGLRGIGNVFLLSGTYFSETTGLAAAIATISELQKTEFYNGYNDYPKSAIDCINQVGRFLVRGINESILKHNTKLSDGTYLSQHIKIKCHGKEGTKYIEGANPSMTFSSMELKTLFDQETVHQGILMPYIAPSLSHTEKDVRQTIEAAEMALATCKKAIDNECVKESLLGGHCEAPVFRRT
jgi:glutamate-1-semialdehyde 2,1-aminomutase